MIIRILKIDDWKNCDYAFSSYEKGRANCADYKVVFEDELELSAHSTTDLLAEIYEYFDDWGPFDGYGIGVSDVVYLDGEYYYYDSFGWNKLENF